MFRNLVCKTVSVRHDGCGAYQWEASRIFSIGVAVWGPVQCSGTQKTEFGVVRFWWVALFHIFLILQLVLLQHVQTSMKNYREKVLATKTNQ